MVVEEFMVLVEGGCICLTICGFLMSHLKGYLEGNETFLSMCICLLVLVLGG